MASFQVNLDQVSQPGVHIPLRMHLKVRNGREKFIIIGLIGISKEYTGVSQLLKQSDWAQIQDFK